MSAQTATVIFIVVILGLFVLERDRKTRTSVALWLPVVWLLIVGSREVTRWMQALGVADVGGSDLEGNPIDRNLYLVLLVLALITLVWRRAQVRRLLQENLPIVLFFLYCALSVLWSDYPAVAFKKWIKALGDVVMVMVVLTDPNRLAAVKRLLTRTSFLLIPLSILLIKWYPFLGMGYKRFDGTAVFTGVTVNKNILGLICLLFGLGSQWRLFALYRQRPSRQRTCGLIAHSMLLAMVLWLLVHANSMTGVSCFLLAGTLMAAASFRPVVQRRWVVHVLVGVVVLGAFSILFLDIGSGSLQAIGRDPTLTGRTVIWNLVLSLTGNPLIGAGFESFWLPGWRRDQVWEAYWWHPNEAHNGYIEIFLNLGWIGIVLMAVIIVTSYRKVVRAVRRDSDLGTLSLAYFVVGIIYNFTEAGFRMLDPVWITFLLAIIASSKLPLPKVAPLRNTLRANDATPWQPDLDRGLLAGSQQEDVQGHPTSTDPRKYDERLF
jgi:exopolysaccharide production protein ExoQ